jgi:MerR family transcriptional regulator, light-induced transcriptional regulator
MPRPPRFTIRAASALTGINQNTLRAWERRYGLISPERTAKGYRLYSDEDIERLRLIQRAIHEGVSVGRVRAYLQARGAVEHVRGGVDTAAPTPGDAPPAQTPLADCCARIEEAARRLDRMALERAYKDSVGLYSIREAFHRALGPALRCICPHGGGDSCQATERFLTEFARERLARVLGSLRPLHQPPRALFACVPGETNEIELMLLSLEVGLEGVSALYLGAGTAMETVQTTADTTGSRAIVLSATTALPREAVLGLRDALAGLPRRPRLLIEGPATQAHRDWLEASGIEALAPVPAEAAKQVLQAVEAG